MKKTFLITLLAIGILASAASCANPVNPSGTASGAPVGSPDGSTSRDSGCETEIETTTACETEWETDPSELTSAPEDTTSAPESETEAAEDTAAESDTDAAEPPSGLESERYFQFPLLNAHDETSYVSLPDMAADGPKAIELFVVPDDTESPTLTSAGVFRLPISGETNVMVIAATSSTGDQSLLYLQDSSYVSMVDGEETRYVHMVGANLYVFDIIGTPGQIDYAFLHGGGSADFRYTEDTKSIALRYNERPNDVALKHVERLISEYSEREDCTFTILYSYVNGVETINTPVESVPEFHFELFKQYGYEAYDD